MMETWFEYFFFFLLASGIVLRLRKLEFFFSLWDFGFFFFLVGIGDIVRLYLLLLLFYYRNGEYNRIELKFFAMRMEKTVKVILIFFESMKYSSSRV